MYFKIIAYYFILMSLGVLIGCSTGSELSNPAAEGFNISASDQKAINIADAVMTAMGGRKNWDESRFISWDFFGSRKLWWDKHTGNVRVESQKEDYTVLVNIYDLSGKVKKNGVEISHPDSLAKYLEKGKNAWINDSYWLVMPFKLKDTGVTLKYLRQDTTQTGELADVLQLTFEKVGETPQNKYEVFVDKESRLVTQWTFYANADDPEPRFTTAWKDYKRYGKILLSGDRGNGYLLKDIKVEDSMPERLFREF